MSKTPTPDPVPTISDRELRITAAMYAARPGVAQHLKETGKLPARINMGGGHIQSRVLIRNRGLDIELRPDEKLVYEAILRERRLPGGHVLVLPHPEDRPLSFERASLTTETHDAV